MMVATARERKEKERERQPREMAGGKGDKREHVRAHGKA
jgi:hypothetical protein